MGRRVTEQEKERIRELMQKGLSVKEIAGEAGLKYNTTYLYVKAYKEGFSSTKEYWEHLALNRGFSSLTEYQKYKAKNRGFKSTYKYKAHLVKQRGFNSLYEYQLKLARQHGYSSLSEYNKEREKQRKQRAEYQDLSKLIREKLEELGKNQRWLAKELGITPQAVNLYVYGKAFPNEKILKKLDRILLINKDDLEGRVVGSEENGI